MIKLLKNAQVYSPAPLGKKDVLVIGDKVARIDDSIQGYDGLPEVEVIDLKGKKLLPGYIDIHIHITGGGGEQGFTSRVPAQRYRGQRHHHRAGPAGHRRHHPQHGEPHR